MNHLIFCARKGCGAVVGSVELPDDAQPAQVRRQTAGYLCENESDMRLALSGTTAEEAIRRVKRAQVHQAKRERRRQRRG